LLYAACVGFMVRQGRRFGAVAVAAAAAAAPADALDAAERFAWQRVPAGAQGEVVGALAIEPGSGRLAVGDPVRDLAYLPDAFFARGTLLAATASGLFRVAADGRAAPVGPGPGLEARDVHRIAVSAEAVAVATEAGAFLSSDGERWDRASPRLPLAASRAVALRERGDGLECFAVLEERLWRVWLRRTGEGFASEDVVQEPLPRARVDGAPVDVVFDIGGADVVAVLATAFAVRETRSTPWRLVRPALPPGAQAQRLAAAHGRLWLATDRGLLVAPAFEGPWVRAAAPAGTADVHAVVGDVGQLYVAAGDRVLRARVAAAAPAPSGDYRLRTPEGDPAIEHVHRAALAYLDLRPARIGALRRGLSRRGWLPIVALRLGHARDEEISVDRDESFVSGATRLLVDRDSQRTRDQDLSLTFSWDLGDIAYHPEQIDVSREAREVIKLRDDVLDEVTQLYFDRRRTLAELGARPDAPPAEKLRLRLRAAELAAGIDAWTGGWFTRARAASGP
jgi:hypothetical protein